MGCDAVFAHSLTIQMQPRISLAQIVMSFCVVFVSFQILLVLLDGFLVRILGFLSFCQCLVGKAQTEMGFRQVTIQLDGLLKGVSSFLVLIVEVKLLTLLDQGTRLKTVRFSVTAGAGGPACVRVGRLIAMASAGAQNQRQDHNEQSKL